MEPLFGRNEFSVLLENISREYGIPMGWLLQGTGKVILPEADMPDDELTLYFPVAVSSRSLLNDLKKLMHLLQLHLLADPERKSIEKNVLDPFFLKYRAYLSCMTQIGKPEIALAARKQILDFCNSK